MKKPALYVWIALIAIASVCCSAGLFVALDAWPWMRMAAHALFRGNEVLNPDTDLVVVSDVWGREGYMDNRGNVVIWPRFKYARMFKGGMACVRKGDTSGYIDIGGEYIIPPKFNWVDDFEGGMAVAGANGKSGVIDSSGNFVIQPEYTFLTRISDEFYKFSTEEYREGSNKLPPDGILDKSGTIVLQAEYDYFFAESDGMIRFMQNDSYGYFDSSSRSVLHGRYANAHDFYGGVASVQDMETRRWGIIDKRGNTVVPFQYAFIAEFSDGLAAAQDPDTKLWGFLDTKGVLAIPCRFEFGEDVIEIWRKYSYPRFNGGLALITDGKNNGFLINKKGETIVESFAIHDLIADKYHRYPELFTDISQYGYSGMGLHWVEHTPGVLTFYDEKGLRFTTEGEAAGVFSDGLCRVGVGVGLNDLYTDKEKYGYIDETGKRVIDFRFHFSDDFANGLAAYNTLNLSFFGWSRYGYIDKSGHILWLPRTVKQKALSLAFAALVALAFLIALPRIVKYFRSACTGPGALQEPAGNTAAQPSKDEK